jgi:hypothetical protein
MTSKILFTERQRFNQWWLYLILIVTAIATIIPFVMILVQEGFDTSILTLTGVISILVLLMIGCVLILRLETTITNEKLMIQFYPFLKKEWNWNEIKTAQVIDYGLVGGWGIRIWTGYGTVYNVSGSKGLHFKTDSKEYVIGTQKEEKLRSSIAHLLK